MVLLTAFAVGAAAKYQADKDGGETPKPPCFDTNGKVCLDLLPIETEDRTMLENPIATITYFDGNPRTAASYLERRVSDIVRANPWLGGRLHRGTYDGVVRLWYDEQAKDTAPDLFKKFTTDDLFVAPEMQYKLLCTKLSTMGAKVGRNCDLVGRNEAVWRVSLIPYAVVGKFLLVVSMSHAVGDGHTFYKIFKMLDGRAEIETLNPLRNMEFDSAAEKVMGKDGVSYLPDPGNKPSFWEKVKREKAHNVIFTVEERWIEEQKALAVPKQSEEDGSNADPADAGVSTNDVIVSWFFRTTGATVGFQVSNLRNRIEGDAAEGAVSDLDAGNYFRPVPFTDSDYRDPRLLRRSILTTGGTRRVSTLADEGGSGVRKVTELPEFSWESRHAVATNWRSVHGPDCALKLGDKDDGSSSFARQGRHVPFYDNKDIALIPRGVSALIIFTERPGAVGMHVVGPKSVVSEVESSGIVKEMIASF